MHLLIVRHGECAGQVDPTLGMDPDTVLTPRGETQAAQLGRRLAELGVTRLLSSPLRRALATAQIVAKTAGQDRFAVWYELRELWEPVWLPVGRDALQREFTHAAFPASEALDGWQHGDTSAEAARDRAACVLERLLQEHGAEARVALITHGGFATCLLSAMLQIPPAQPAWFDLVNGAITQVRLVPPHERQAWPPLYPAFPVEVLALNDQRHLRDEPPA